jgi:hypothetical protein
MSGGPQDAGVSPEHDEVIFDFPEDA